jgi:hypothetical protein
VKAARVVGSAAGTRKKILFRHIFLCPLAVLLKVRNGAFRLAAFAGERIARAATVAGTPFGRRARARHFPENSVTCRMIDKV